MLMAQISRHFRSLLRIWSGMHSQAALAMFQWIDIYIRNPDALEGPSIRMEALFHLENQAVLT